MTQNIKMDISENSARFFTSDQDIFHNAYLKRACGSWYAYADGYRRAADIINKNCQTFYDRNTLVYPMIFLYRQYIELALKDIIREGNKVIKKENKLPAIHSLDKLWAICVLIINERNLPIPGQQLKSVKKQIDEFNQVDPGSMAFRYPETKEGAPILPADLDAVGLQNLSGSMDALSKLLKKIGSLLDADIELEREHRDYEEFY
jgi:hypothetical protein